MSLEKSVHANYVKFIIIFSWDFEFNLNVLIQLVFLNEQR